MADIITNSKARRDYHVVATYECGIVLHGTEVKALRAGKAQISDAFARVGLVTSKGAARRTVAEGGAYVGNVRATDAEAVLTDADLLHGRWVLLRRGRRHIGGLELVDA